MIKNLLRLFSKLDYHVKGILLAIPFAIALLVSLVSLGAADLIFTDWFVTLISIPSFISSQLSAFGYFGRMTDLFRHLKKTFAKNKHEFIGNIFGFLTGIAIAISVAVTGIGIPLVATLGVFANIIFAGRQINTFAGLGSRLGKCADKDSRPLSEKIIVILSLIAGIIFGSILFLTFSASVVTVVGISAFFSGGAIFPVWLSGIIFVLTISSSMASAGDYFAKALNFIRSFFMNPGHVTKQVANGRYDYGGALLGVCIGIVVGAIIIAAIAAFNPPILAGLVGIAAGALIVITSISVFGGICSLCGRIIDGIKRAPPGDYSALQSNEPDEPGLLKKTDKEMRPLSNRLKKISIPSSATTSKQGIFQRRPPPDPGDACKNPANTLGSPEEESSMNPQQNENHRHSHRASRR